MRILLKNGTRLVHMNILLLSVLFVGLSIVFVNRNSKAEEIRRDTKRIEAVYSFEGLRPNGVYGNWKTGTISFYDNSAPGVSYFLKGSFYDRPDGSGELGTIGAYLDWTDSFYTYSDFTAGSRSSYLPKSRIDTDFNYKFGYQKKYIFTCGFSAIDYFTDYSDLIFSIGPTIYWKHFVFQYRWFQNASQPGNVRSNSQLFSVGYGVEGRQWTYINFSFGNEAYLVSGLDRSLTFDNSSYDINLQHRHWIGRHYGLLGNMEYFDLKNGYEKIGFSIGAFYEF